MPMTSHPRAAIVAPLSPVRRVTGAFAARGWRVAGAWEARDCRVKGAWAARKGRVSVASVSRRRRVPSVSAVKHAKSVNFVNRCAR